MITIPDFEGTTDLENVLGTTVTTSDACECQETEAMTPPHVNGSKNSTPTSVPTKRKKHGMISEKPESSGDEFTNLYV